MQYGTANKHRQLLALSTSGKLLMRPLGRHATVSLYPMKQAKNTDAAAREPVGRERMRVAAVSLACGRDGATGVLLKGVGKQFEQRGAIALCFRFTYPRHPPEVVERCRPHAGQFAQGLVVQDDIRRHALLAGESGAPGA